MGSTCGVMGSPCGVMGSTCGVMGSTCGVMGSTCGVMRSTCGAMGSTCGVTYPPPQFPPLHKCPWSSAPGYPPAPTHTCTRRASSSAAAGRVRRTRPRPPAPSSWPTSQFLWQNIEDPAIYSRVVLRPLTAWGRGFFTPNCGVPWPGPEGKDRIRGAPDTRTHFAGSNLTKPGCPHWAGPDRPARPGGFRREGGFLEGGRVHTHPLGSEWVQTHVPLPRVLEPPCLAPSFPPGHPQSLTGGQVRRALQRTTMVGETALPASGPRPVRVHFFGLYRAARVRSASSPRPLSFLPGCTQSSCLGKQATARAFGAGTP
eukprot:gene22615-biopygen22251